MALDSLQQLNKILSSSKKILILLPENINGDVIGAGWAFYFFLRKKGMEPILGFSGGQEVIDNRYSFLPTPTKIVTNLSGARDFVLSFNTKHNKINNVRTQEGKEELRIYITPQKSSIDPRDFSFIPAKFVYDSVFTLGCVDQEALGEIIEDNPDIFYEIPVVNIDSNSHNDNFGKVNIVNMNASSVSEVLISILESIDKDSIDEKMYECLLMGIISATESFQNHYTTPKSLKIASQLIDSGVNQQKIIRYLYKTQPLNILKLWGRVMAKINWDEDLQLVWSSINVEDFVQSRTRPQDIPLILEKVKDNYSAAKLFLVLFNETQENVKGILKAERNEKIEPYSKALKGKFKGGIYEFSVDNDNVVEAERLVLKSLRNSLRT